MKTARNLAIAAFLLAAFSILGPIGQAAETAPACSPPEALKVTLLARPKIAGAKFVALLPDGNPPYVDPATDRTITQMRMLVAELGGKVIWSEGSQIALFMLNNQVLEIPVIAGVAGQATLNRKPFNMGAFICNGRLYGPVRAVTDALLVPIKWYENSNTVVADPMWSNSDLPIVWQPVYTAAESPILPPSQASQGSGSTGSESDPFGKGAITRATLGDPNALSEAPAPGAISGPSKRTCEEYPDSFWDYIFSPNQSSRKAARATACHIIKNQMR